MNSLQNIMLENAYIKLGEDGRQRWKIKKIIIMQPGNNRIYNIIMRSTGNEVGIDSEIETLPSLRTE